jgi:outer membrane protein OmpA-like peptidoglycan-associated protein
VDLRLQLPTSAPGNFVGERRPRVTPGFTFDIGPPRAKTVLGLQLLFRERVITDYDLELHHEFALLVGGRVAIVPGRLAAFGEFSLRATMRHETSGEGQTPVDVRLGVRGHPVPQLAVDLAVGAGLTSGYGTARVRVLLGITAVGLPDHPRRSRPEVAKRPDGPLPESEREAGPSPPPPEPIDLLSDEDMPNLPELDPCAPDRRQVFLYDSFEADPDAPAVVVEVDDSAPTEAGTTWGWHIGGGREAAGQDPLAELRAGEDRIRIREPIPFEYDSDVLLPEAFPLLDAVRHILEQRPDIGLLVIEGHASSEGTVAYNWDLSNRRATSVFRYLVEAGVNPYRLAWRGMGEAVPRTDGEEVTGDRRVEFRIETWLEPDAIPDWRDAPPVPWKELHP